MHQIRRHGADFFKGIGPGDVKDFGLIEKGPPAPINISEPTIGKTRIYWQPMMNSQQSFGGPFRSGAQADVHGLIMFD
jgi:hypothetical protein